MNTTSLKAVNFNQQQTDVQNNTEESEQGRSSCLRPPRGCARCFGAVSYRWGCGLLQFHVRRCNQWKTRKWGSYRENVGWFKSWGVWCQTQRSTRMISYIFTVVIIWVEISLISYCFSFILFSFLMTLLINWCFCAAQPELRETFTE